MNSNDVRHLIATALAHEQNTRAMKKRLMARGLAIELQRITLDVVEGYLHETPDLLDVADDAARTAGLRAVMQPLFEAAFHYWDASDDVSPDRLGLYGLIDDAYLTRTLLEKVAVEVRSRTGRPLFSVDLSTSNRAIRDLLGYELTAELDEKVNAVVHGRQLRTFFDRMAETTAAPLEVPLPTHGQYLGAMLNARGTPDARALSGALGTA